HVLICFFPKSKFLFSLPVFPFRSFLIPAAFFYPFLFCDFWDYFFLSTGLDNSAGLDYFYRYPTFISMSYIHFDKSQLINLNYSLEKELIRANRSGCYTSTTIIGCNTRKYHGLLVAPQPQIDTQLHVMLSTVHETIVQHGATFNLGITKYPGNYFPRGHKYLEDFNSEPIPKLTFRVGGVSLQKELILDSDKDRVMIRYTLFDAHSTTKLRLNPFLAFRGHHSLSKANTYVNKKFDKIKQGVQF